MAVIRLNAKLRRRASRLLAEPEVYVTGNLLLYYEQGNRSAAVAPDVFVVRGVAKGRRKTYLLWRERHSASLTHESHDFPRF